jgi:hypothetical protein
VLLQQNPTAWSSSAGMFLLAARAASAGVLGGAVCSMLLGHWYLTAPTMSIQPLFRLTQFYGIALLLRIAVSAVVLATAGPLTFSSTQWTWFSIRWLAGLIAPLVMVVMVFRILKIRNTQAATGVLFASVILTFFGEMSAALLLAELKRPL